MKDVKPPRALYWFGCWQKNRITIQQQPPRKKQQQTPNVSYTQRSNTITYGIKRQRNMASGIPILKQHTHTQLRAVFVASFVLGVSVQLLYYTKPVCTPR